MKYLTIIILFFIHNSYSQNVDAIQSRNAESKGWELYFEGNKKEAKSEFKNAIKFDSTNVLAKIGLFNSKSESEFTIDDLDFVTNLPKEDKYSSVMHNLMMLNQVDKDLSDSVKSMRNKYDEQHIKFKALLTEKKFVILNENGNPRITGLYKNRKPIGIWNQYFYSGELYSKTIYPIQGDTVITKYFNLSGDLKSEKWFKGDPRNHTGTRIKEITYWQENPGKKPEYLPVSKTGFVTYDKENPVVFDEKTPDNIIEREWDNEKKQFIAYIWKNGKKEPYDLCEDDGMIISENIDNVVKTYRWENCKKILIDN